jgi:membrane fusion protein (multidrug efflux system)
MRLPTRFRPSVGAATLLLLAATLAGCGKEAPAQAGGGQPPPTEVSIVVAQAERLPIITDLPGRLEATRTAEVRARVPGIVLKREFREGSDVKAGQLLFRIDPAPLRANVAVAQANLKQAEASLYEAKLLEQRYAPLAKVRAVSQQEYDQSLAARRQAEARVAQQKAALDAAQLDLGYATVTAPISGRIGRSLVTEGALVGQGEVTPLALIQQIDPVYVNLTQSVADLTRLRAAVASGALGKVEDNTAPISLTLSDGTAYPIQGKLLFSDISVDPSTGQVSLRAEFANPDGILLPGMYVRASVEQGIREQALAVPQQAIQRGTDGKPYLLVVDAEQTAQVRPVTTGSMIDTRWVIDSGLQPGDQVIVDRFQQVRPGSKVKPTPWQQAKAGGSPAAPAAKQQ